MAATSVLEPTKLDFLVSNSTVAKLVATSSIFTFSGAAGGTVELKGLTVPSDGTSAANKSYVDGVASGLKWLGSVKTSSTANVTLSADVEDGDSLDGVTLATGDRILLKDQTTATENGVYVVAATGAPARAIDLKSGDSAAAHSVFVEGGTENGDQGYVCTDDAGFDVVGTDDLVWTQFTGLGQITAGEALSKSGNTIDVNVDGSSIEVSADALQVKALGVTNDMLAGSIANAKLSNSAVTVTAGDGLQTGGSVSLGSSVTVEVDSTVIRTTGGQTIAGTETFSGAISVSGTAQDSGLIEFADTSAPTTTTNKLYSVGGNLTWAGTTLNQGANVNAGGVSKLAYYSDATTIDDAAGIAVSTTNSAGDTLTVYKIAGTNGDYSGNFEVDGELDVPTDSGKIRLGAGYDLEIAHNGTYSHMSNNTGEFLIANAANDSDLVMKLGETAGVTAFKVKDSSESTILEMNSAGAGTVTGSWIVDSVKIDGATIGHTTDTDLLTLASAQLTVAGNMDVTSGVDVSGAAITASSGITNTAGVVSVTGGSVKLADDIYLYAGTDSDFSMNHDNSNMYMTNGTGNLVVSTSGANASVVAKVGTADSNTSFKVVDEMDATCFVVDGGKGAQCKGLLTTEAGVTNSAGEVLISGGNVQLNDNVTLTVGTGDDFSLSHDGTNTTMASGTGHLLINNTHSTSNTLVTLGNTDAGVNFKVTDSMSTDLFTVDGTGAAAVTTTLTVNSTTDSTSSGSGALQVLGGIGVVANVYSDAKMYSTGFNTHSDENLKRDATDVTEDEANKLNDLKPKHFFWKDPARGPQRQCGFLAQEVQTVLPDLVDKQGDYLSVNYVALIPLLVKKIHMLEGKVNSLSA